MHLNELPRRKQRGIRPVPPQAGLKRWFIQRFPIQPERAFVYFGIGFGLMFVFLTPPFQSPDEYAHFFRAYHLSEGRLVPKGNDPIPRSLIDFAKAVSPYPEHGASLVKIGEKTLFKQWKQPFTEEARIPENKSIDCISYSPIPYIPQAIGVASGRLLRIPPIAIFYLGRLLNLAFWIVMVRRAIVGAPILKWAFFLLALMPMSLFQAASNSVDAQVNALSLLFLSGIFQCAFNQEEKIPLRNRIGLGLLIFLLGAAKPIYFLLVGVFFIIPIQRFGGMKRYFAFFGILMLLALIAPIAWYRITHGAVNIGPHTDVTRQIQLIVNSPWAFIRLLGRNLIQQMTWQQHSFIGILGWLDTRLPEFVYPLYSIGLFAAAALNENPDIRISYRIRLYCLSVFMAIGIGIFIFIYVTFSPTGWPNIIGVQGRYFIPIAPLLFLSFANLRIRQPWWFGLSATVFIFIITLIALGALEWRFYLP